MLAKRYLRALAQSIAMLMTPCLPMPAQQAESEQPPNPHYVLHAYANRIQVPTLVVNSNNQLPPPLPRDRFTISLDSGQPFHPTQIRTEGDDPISLAVVLDDSGSQTAIMSGLAQTFASLAPDYLRPADHISVFVVDCKMFRTVLDKVISAPQLQESITAAFAAPGLHGTKPRPACGHSLRLWDTVAVAATALASVPGRRVMLIVSPGEDEGSKMPFRRLSEFISSKSIAVFGLRDQAAYPASFLTRKSILSASELTLDLLCTVNGGLVIDTDRKHLESALQQFVTFIRSRYILEFPAPYKGELGIHSLDVKVIGKGSLIALATGASSTAPDAAILADPSTIKSSPSPAVFGPRRPLPSGP